ncbi:unnamed protein product [Notodromas monacha]|uniref:Uncharacterized protein n=1 Tax=Notodromas monacha TaxID=399045 RepID=A0A7R9GD93_9CRUS|nr:unnamed protein product [Notodromas monacha]CAG0918443.1 unnamed protein product [Notodromas monacha]
MTGAWQSSASNSVAGGQHHPSATGGATGGNQPQSGSGSSPHGPPMPQPPAGMKPGTATGSDSATGANNNKSSDPGPAGNSNATTVPRPANGTATDVRPTVAVAAALALVGMAKLVQHSPAKRELLQETKLVTDAVAELECLVENTALSMSLMKTKPCNSPSKDTLVYLASNGGKFTPVLTGGVEELVANLDQILATRSDQDIRLICQEVREYRIYLENFIKSRSPQVMGGGDHLVSTFSLDTIPVVPAVSQGTMCSLGSFSSTDTLSYKA